MRQIMQVRSNLLYTLPPSADELSAMVEIIIIHTDGMSYKTTKGGDIATERQIVEQRFIVSPSELKRIIAGLSQVQIVATRLENNAIVLNGIIQELTAEPGSEKSNNPEKSE